MIKLNYPIFWSYNNILSTLLTPLSWIYYLAGYLRSIAIKPVRLPGKVICIGNMSVGGTGKTQMAIYIANIFKKKSVENFVIITKGYKSSLKGAKLVSLNDSPDQVGDESLLLAKYAKVIAAKKITDAIPLLEKLKAEYIIVDDGMQNPSFYKDYIILIMDAMRNLGNGKLLPAGPLREYPEAAFKKANMAVIISNDECDVDDFIPKNYGKPAFSAQINMTNLEDIDLSKNYFAFSAIGNCQRFFDMLKNHGLNLIKTKSFPDHYHYNNCDINHLKQEASALGSYLITTNKDLVKIADKANILAAEVTLSFAESTKIDSIIETLVR